MSCGDVDAGEGRGRGGEREMKEMPEVKRKQDGKG